MTRMKRLMAAGLGTLAVLLMASNASATAISFSDTFDPTDRTFDAGGSTACTGNNTTDTITGSSPCKSLSWTQSLGLSTPGSLPYSPLTDILSTGTLTLTLYDEDDPGQQADKFDITVDLFSSSNVTVTSGSTSGTPFVIPLNILTQLTADGLVAISLTASVNDFVFAKSVLTAAGDRQVSTAPNDPLATPEPASLVLLGSGLAALAARARAKATRKKA